jgi:TonB family protein
MVGLKIAFILGIAILLFPARTVAQRPPARFGPVVSAYLTGLTEELNELEYQIRHQEISRADYERARQRLILQRRYIERFAATSPVDIAPELQILTAAELKPLGLLPEPTPERLIPGAVFDQQWRLFAVEGVDGPGRSRFYIFERIQRAEIGAKTERVTEKKRNRALDLQAVETIVIDERPPQVEPPKPAPPVTATVVQPGETIAAAADLGQNRLQLPRIRQLTPPMYTDKARERKVEGDLVLRALFLKDGKIKNIKIQQGLGFGLDQRAEEAVKRITFTPAQIDGRVVDAEAEIVFGFSLARVSVAVRSSSAGVVVKGMK